ncbi:hypothetical protein FK873_gp097 [Micromonas pusilla virus SP1]|jgi:hypothetical protein|uniref:Uncharacterized protein n=1 Tax=Micromonas pusilla virus SP1 TaxID=373996 RepID=G9E668_MPSP1|nr:hypothetical protein FK873_gp097 [Micromonas pusilla virus SP1]AET84895.1 hypothetical protein MPXG_00097 [Micromonas pusilla virus SP1]
MFREMFKDPKFVGAQISPPNNVVVVTDDGVEQYTTQEFMFKSEATIDKQSKEVKGTTRGKDKIIQLFIEPIIRKKGRFTVTIYEF